MKQIFLVVVLLAIAYGVSYLSGGRFLNKQVGIEKQGQNEQVLITVNKEDLVASLNSLNGEERKKAEEVMKQIGILK